MRFTKMQGIGNDYLYVNLLTETVPDPADLAVRMSRQHFGCGSDGLVLIGPSDTADVSMRIFNADGSEAEMCGNAVRCIGRYVYERGLTDRTDLRLQTRSGFVGLRLRLRNGQVESVRVDMGAPRVLPREIPVLLTGEHVLDRPVRIAGRIWNITCVSMGNPHCVVFVDEPEKLDLNSIGPQFEHDPLFPERTNTEFVQASPDRRHLTMRVWERGSGETLACGTGACAALAAAVLTGRSERTCEMKLRGGTLSLSWDAESGHIYQEGPAEYVYDGVWLGDASTAAVK